MNCIAIHHHITTEIVDLTSAAFGDSTYNITALWKSFRVGCMNKVLSQALRSLHQTD